MKNDIASLYEDIRLAYSVNDRICDKIIALKTYSPLEEDYKKKANEFASEAMRYVAELFSDFIDILESIPGGFYETTLQEALDRHLEHERIEREIWAEKLKRNC